MLDPRSSERSPDKLSELLSRPESCATLMLLASKENRVT
jgi:hypothetical protein